MKNLNLSSNRWLKSCVALSLGVAGMVAVVRAEPNGDAPTPVKEKQDRPARPDGQRPGAAFERMKQFLAELDLSAEQRATLEPILKDARQKGQQLMRDAEGMQPRERILKLADFLADTREKIKDVLTDEQKLKFEEQLKEVRSRLQERVGEAGIGGRVKEALAKLDLTPEQKEQADKILADAKEKVLDLRKTTAEKTKQSADEMRTQTREIMTEVRQKLASILTPSQREQLRDLMQADPGPSPRPRERKPVNAAVEEPKDRP